MAILRDATPALEQVSVDEAYLDLSAEFPGGRNRRRAGASVALAEKIKARIAAERALTASIGIGSNKFLAKLGSDFNKPNGLTLIPEREKTQFLRPLSIRTIQGLGPVTAQALAEKGISPSVICRTPRSIVIRSWDRSRKS